jgi:hypothetical protein
MGRRSLLAVVVLAMVGTLIQIGGTASAVRIGNEGCTPGYWKNHTSDWEEASPDQTLASLGWTFGAENSEYADLTMLQALSAKGGTGIDGATQVLIRAATAAWLNAAHEGVGYPYRRFATGLNGRRPLIELINEALTSDSRRAMIRLAKKLDDANNLGCEL